MDTKSIISFNLMFIRLQRTIRYICIWSDRYFGTNRYLKFHIMSMRIEWFFPCKSLFYLSVTSSSKIQNWNVTKLICHRRISYHCGAILITDYYLNIVSFHSWLVQTSLEFHDTIPQLNLIIWMLFQIIVIKRLCGHSK